MDIQNILNEMIACVKEVGAFQEQEIDKIIAAQIETKDVNSLVSYVDKESEQMLVAKAQSLLPDSGFITEENVIANEEKAYTWIIDPLDGTTNYLHRIPHYSISVALKKNEDLILGIVYDPAKKECFHAIIGHGAFLNGKAISISENQQLAEAIIVTGFPYSNSYDVDQYVELVKYWLLNTRGIRRLGSAALDLAYIACGRLDAYYEANLNAWDLAAGQLLVEEAGGKCTDINAGPEVLSTGSIIAANTALHRQIYDVINTVLK